MNSLESVVMANIGLDREPTPHEKDLIRIWSEQGQKEYLQGVFFKPWPFDDKPENEITEEEKIIQSAHLEGWTKFIP